MEQLLEFKKQIDYEKIGRVVCNYISRGYLLLNNDSGARLKPEDEAWLRQVVEEIVVEGPYGTGTPEFAEIFWATYSGRKDAKIKLASTTNGASGAFKEFTATEERAARLGIQLTLLWYKIGERLVKSTTGSSVNSTSDTGGASSLKELSHILEQRERPTAFIIDDSGRVISK